MTTLPMIQIRQQQGRIGIETEWAQLEIRQPKATMEIQSTPTQLEFHSPGGMLEIDQSRAWDALTGGTAESFNNRIYSQAKNVLLAGIARRVEEGKRMAAIHEGGNAIADIARQRAFSENTIRYFGTASYDNVDIRYTAQPVESNIVAGGVDIQITPNRPEFAYQPGRVDIYMLQYPSIEMIPPQIDEKR